MRYSRHLQPCAVCLLSLVSLDTLAAQAKEGSVDLSGQVRDVLGQPIVAAQVEASWPVSQRPTQRTSTDATGRWSLGRVGRAEPMLILARAPSFAVTESRWPPAVTPHDGAPLDLTLRDAERVSGTVRDAEGKPVAGVALCAGPGIEALTGLDGTYELSAPVGRTWICAHRPGFRLATESLQVGRETTLDFTLPAYDSAPVQVRIRSGTEPSRAFDPPAMRFEVSVLGGATLPDSARWLEPNAEGTAGMHGLGAGMMHIDLHDQHGWSRAPRVRSVGASSRKSIELQVPSGAERSLLRGRVMDGDGNGIGGLTLLVADQQVVSDATGRFACPQAAADRAIPVHVVSDDWTLSATSRIGVLRDVNAGGRIFPRVIKAAHLHGQVFGPDRQPLAHATLVLRPLAPNIVYPPEGRVVQSATDGRFSFGGLAPSTDSFELVVLSERGVLAMTITIPVVPAVGATAPLVLHTDPAAQARGRLVDHTGQPMAGAEVRLRPAIKWGHAVPLSAATTNRHGEFAFTGLPSGRYEVLLPPRYQERFALLDLEAGEVGQVGELRADR